MNTELIVRGQGCVTLSKEYSDQLSVIQADDVIGVNWYGCTLILAGDEIGVAHRCRRILCVRTGRMRHYYVLVTNKRMCIGSSRGTFIAVPHLVVETVPMMPIRLEETERRRWIDNSPISQIDDEMLEEEWRATMRAYATEYGPRR